MNSCLCGLSSNILHGTLGQSAISCLFRAHLYDGVPFGKPCSRTSYVESSSINGQHPKSQHQMTEKAHTCQPEFVCL